MCASQPTMAHKGSFANWSEPLWSANVVLLFWKPRSLAMGWKSLEEDSGQKSDW